MKKRYIKIFSFILCLIMLLGFSALAVAAADSYTPVVWQMDDNLETLYGNGKRYDAYYTEKSYYTDPKTEFIFMNDLYFKNTRYSFLGNSAEPSILFAIDGEGYGHIFVNAEGKKSLDAFFDKTDVIYYLEKNLEQVEISEETVNYLDSEYKNPNANFETVNVTELKNGKIYDITMRDRTETVACEHGAIYVMQNGKYYYVCFENLDNSYFSADGFFSYRSGSVKAYILDDETCAIINTVIDSLEYRYTTTTFEWDVVNGFYDIFGDPIYGNWFTVNEGMSLFFFVISLFGIVIPCVTLVLSLIFANAKKTGKAKCWIAVSASSGLCIISTVIFLILVLVK